MEEIRINFYHYMNSPQDPNYPLYKKLQELSTQLRQLQDHKANERASDPTSNYWITGDGSRSIIRQKSEVEAARAAAFAVEPTPAGTLIIKHRGASLEYTVLSTAGVIKGIYFCKEPDIGGVVVKFSRHNSTIDRLSVLGRKFVPYVDVYSQHIFLKEDDAKRLYDFYTNRLLLDNKSTIRAQEAAARGGAAPQLSLASAGGGAAPQLSLASAGGGAAPQLSLASAGGGGGRRKNKSRKH
jgi:hypothetical protein